MKYYDWTKTLSYDSPITIVIGARGIGKTFGLRLQCIRDFMKNGSTFVEVSRFTSEQQMVKKGYFDRLSSFFPEAAFKVEGNKGFISTSLTEKGKHVWETLCYFLSLSELQKTKKMTFAGVKRIIFDEALIDRTDKFHRYGESEWEQLANLVDSVSRERPDSESHPRLYLLGNAVDLTNPFFQALGIRSTPPEGYSWHLSKTALLHVSKDDDYGRGKQTQTLAGKMLAGTAAGAAAAFNRFDDSSMGSVGRKPSDAIFKYGLLYNDERFGIWWSDRDSRFYVTPKIPDGGRTLALTIKGAGVATPLVDKAHPVVKTLLEFMRIDGVRFSSLRLRATFLEACNMVAWL